MVVLGGLAGTPVVVSGIAADSPVAEVEMATRQTVDSVSELWTDVLAPAAYRAAVAPVLAVRAWRKAAAAAEGERP
jgi:CO/xanthine dehydrogenase FAD-binding subunit